MKQRWLDLHLSKSEKEKAQNPDSAAGTQSETHVLDREGSPRLGPAILVGSGWAVHTRASEVRLSSPNDPYLGYCP